MSKFTAACVQMTSTDDVQGNIAQASALIRAARAAGADLIATPENTGIMAARGELSVAAARPEPEHEALAAYRALAAELDCWLLIGSLGVRIPGESRIANRSYLIRPDGGLGASYDKIHMFDVALASGESYRESRNFRPGERAVCADLPWARLGLTVCYDLRFPQLYRALAHAGAGVLTVPSAFTRPTGEAHWHVLLRARAIETGSFVLAPAQCGTHPGNRRTYGHSLIVGPWGEVLADGGEEPGFILAAIDMALVEKARSQIQALGHDRPFAAPAPLAPGRAAE
ncbi:MAG: carbon-nitrogen hydrolase family protein [Alphaproteobacteria bacterium]|nr:carbon-nitrogen hydrolase family protein [Alphaproteobacteria bacterium]